MLKILDLGTSVTNFDCVKAVLGTEVVLGAVMLVNKAPGPLNLNPPESESGLLKLA